MAAGFCVVTAVPDAVEPVFSFLVHGTAGGRWRAQARERTVRCGQHNETNNTCQHAAEHGQPYQK